ncbi:FkbM family methyltransferase [Brevundimonas sp. AAP58]|uniref:FkbM family methyltransferase n=1 Tax=Brevundimonas sp. AAP58 TaxID=1523422 RepID=UPI000AF692FA|nr:FkbM family methyltransferase [Brevundimonas sp. AAP58]
MRSSALSSEEVTEELGASTVDLNLPLLETDVFRGYLAEDVARIRTIAPADVVADPAFFTDAMGVKVSLDYCPWVWDRTGYVERRLPIPTDTYLGEAIEYAGFAMAVERAAGQDQLSVVELGAGWGPWVSLGAVTAARLGFAKASIVAFEADATRFAAMRRHLTINGVIEADAPDFGRQGRFEWRLHHAAAHSENGALYWPANSNVHDAGMAAIHEAGAVQDYRGQTIDTIEVKAVSVTEAIDHLPVVDFMHIDIQGGEADLIPCLLDVLQQKVRVLFIGTHSRKIEGDFIDLLSSRGWGLHRERPCQFYPLSDAPTLIGRTYVDGAQLWINSRL